MKDDSLDPVASNSEFTSTYENKVRVRVCGICIKDNRILMVRHSNVAGRKTFWAPPGGGINFGESSISALVREFKEEANLTIMPQRFLFINEAISDRLHAIEIFYRVKLIGGDLVTGSDPETKEQLIEEAKWLDFRTINQIEDNSKHNIFHRIDSLEELIDLKGNIEYRF